MALVPRHFLPTPPGRAALLVLLAVAAPRAAAAAPAPPFYDVAVRLDVGARRADVCERVTWVNPGPRPAEEVCFNAHAHYRLPDGDTTRIAKILELVRVAPSDAIDSHAPALAVGRVELLDGPGWSRRAELAWRFRDDQTTLAVPLPRPVGPGEAVSLDLHFCLRLP